MESYFNRGKVKYEAEMPAGYLNKEYAERVQKALVRINCGGKFGTGSFVNFPYKDRTIKTIITNEHVISIGAIKTCKTITLEPFAGGSFSLKLEKTKRYITSFSHDVKHDCTVIEIFDSDPLPKNIFYLDIDEHYLNNNFYKSQPFFLYQYPGKYLGELKIAPGCTTEYNEKENVLFHKASSDHGSSGGILLFGEECAAFAIHFGSNGEHTINYASLLGPIIVEVEKDEKAFWNTINGKTSESKIEVNSNGKKAAEEEEQRRRKAAEEEQRRRKAAEEFRKKYEVS